MGDLGLIPGLGRSPGEGNGYPLQYPDLENSMDYIVHGIAKSQTQLSDFHKCNEELLALTMHPRGLARWLSRWKNLPAVQKSQETWVRSLDEEDPLEEEMAPHSSYLAWRIPWTEEPGGLQSIGLQRVRQDWAIKHTQHKAKKANRIGMTDKATYLMYRTFINISLANKESALCSWTTFCLWYTEKEI